MSNVICGTIIVTEDREVQMDDQEATLAYMNQMFNQSLTINQLEQFLNSQVDQFYVGKPVYSLEEVLEQLEDEEEDVKTAVQRAWYSIYEGQAMTFWEISQEYDRSYLFILDDINIEMLDE